MGVRFILGRAGTGKSHLCLTEICQELQVSALGSPLILIVPEQGSFQAESAIVRHPQLRGSIRAEVLGFRRLAHRIMQQVRGTTRNYIDEAGKRMMLWKVSQQVAPDFTFYRAGNMTDGLLEQMGVLFDEWKRNGITTESLSEFLAKPEVSQTAKLQDLQHIFTAYEHALSNHYVDAEDDLILLANLVEKSHHLKNAEIWVDGFHGFTTLELHVLAQLAIHCRRLTITLCLDREYGAQEQPDELALFYRTATTYKQLHEITYKFRIPAEPTVILSTPYRTAKPALQHLQQSFEQRPAPVFTDEQQTRDALQLYEAVNRRTEVEAVAAEMRRLIRDQHVRWREMAVMVRNLDDYLPLVQQIFPQFEVPFFSDQRRTVTDHPLIECLRASLQSVHRYWRYEDLFRAIKTGFFLPLANHPQRKDLQHAFDVLENVVIAAGLTGKRWLEDKYWAQRLKVDGMAIDDRMWRLVQKCRQLVLGPLLKLQNRLRQIEKSGEDRKAGTVRDAAEAIYDFLCDLQIPDHCRERSDKLRSQGKLDEAEENARIWTSIVHLLDQNVAILGDQPFRSASWLRSFDSGLEALKVGFVPPAIDQVLVGSIDRSRIADIKYMFLLGANEGILPARFAEQGLLGDREREHLIELNLPLSPGSLRKQLDEPFLLYTTVSNCSERLWVSYALGTDAGKGMLPSGFISQLKLMFPTLKASVLDSDATKMTEQQLLDSLQHPQQALQAYSQLSTRVNIDITSSTSTRMLKVIETSLSTNPTYYARLQKLRTAGSYRNRAVPLNNELARQLYGEQLQGSVSRFETFSDCAFAHFAQYGLRLKERARFEISAIHVGQLYHKVLEVVFRQCKDSERKLSELTPEETESAVQQAIIDTVGKLQYSILTSAPEHEYTLEKLTRVVRKTVDAIAQHEATSEFQIKELEWAFTSDSDLLSLRGRVDRMDVALDEQGRRWMRIIDFKSGNLELRLDKLYHGLSLQLLAYLDIAAEQAPQWLRHEVDEAGAFYFQVHDRLESRKLPPTPDEIAKLAANKYKMSGFMIDELPVIQMMDTNLRTPDTTSAIVPMKTAQSGEAHGSYKKNLLSSEQWSELRQFIRNKMASIGHAILTGDTDIKPYKLNGTTPCTYCEYQSVCQFDRSIPGQTYRYLAKMNRDEAMQAIAGTLEKP